MFPLATLRTTLLLRNSTDESLTCAPEGPGVAVFGATQFRTGVCTAVVDPQTGVTTSYWDTCTLNGQMTSTFFFSDGACTPSALDVVQSTPTGCYYKGTTHTCPASLNTIPPGTTIPSSGFYYVNKDSSCMPNPQAPFDSAFNAPLDRCQTASDTGSVYKFVCTPADSLGRRNFTLYRYPAGGDCTVDPIDIVTVPYADGRTCDPRTGIVASCVEASSEDGGASSSSGRGGASSSSSSSSTAGACDGEACAASTIRGALAATLAVAIALFIARLQ